MMNTSGTATPIPILAPLDKPSLELLSESGVPVKIAPSDVDFDILAVVVVCEPEVVGKRVITCVVMMGTPSP